jgi:hypothetical protein
MLNRGSATVPATVSVIGLTFEAFRRGSTAGTADRTALARSGAAPLVRSMT